MTSEKFEEKEFYKAFVSAWYTISLEHDKSLLTLSVGGIGVLIMLIKAQATLLSGMLVMYIMALICFFCCIIAVLSIFRMNSTYIEKVIHSNSNLERAPVFLAIFNEVAIWSFGIAAFLSVFIGIFSVINSYTDKVNQMSNKQIETGKANQIGVEPCSANGASALRPQPAPANPTTQSSNTSNGTPPSTTTNQ